MSPQSGNGSQGDSWGGRGSPPDLGELFRQGKDQFGQMLPGGSTRGFLIIGLLLLIGAGAWSAYYTVPSDSVAVVQRFGQYLKEVPPGLHFKLPLGIDRATIVPVKRQLKQEFGFTTPGASDPYQSPRDGKRETEMVTGDLNAALVEWVPGLLITRYPVIRWLSYNVLASTSRKCRPACILNSHWVSTGRPSFLSSAS